MHELAEIKNKTPSLDLAVLAALNIAQELMELQKHTETIDKEREDKVGQLLAALENELQSIDT